MVKIMVSIPAAHQYYAIAFIALMITQIVIKKSKISPTSKNFDMSDKIRTSRETYVVGRQKMQKLENGINIPQF